MGLNRKKSLGVRAGEKGAALPSGLCDQDWNFRPLAQAEKQELQVAVFWEYSRESALVRSLCLKWVDFSRAGRAGEKDGEVAEVRYELQRIMARMGTGGFDLFLAAEPLANDVSWLALDKGLRADLIERSSGSPHDPLPVSDGLVVYFRPWEPVTRGLVSHLRHEFASEEIERDYKGEIDKKGRETLPFRIDWRLFTNDELVEGFKSWVRQNRPSSESEPEPWKPTKGRGKGTTFYKQLTDLGIMRLFHFKPPGEVVARFRSDDQSLMAAARRARRRFKALLGTDETPIRGLSLSKQKRTK